MRNLLSIDELLRSRPEQPPISEMSLGKVRQEIESCLLRGHSFAYHLATDFVKNSLRVPLMKGAVQNEVARKLLYDRETSLLKRERMQVMEEASRSSGMTRLAWRDGH